MGNSPVKVHISNEATLNFIEKNFKYETYDFADFLKQCVNNCGKYFYLRSLGVDKRGKDVSDIKKHYPTIANDIILPELANFCESIDCNDKLCKKKHLFSSVFRISSKDLVVWTHYDMLDNILLQIEGSKRIILFPPSDAAYLYLIGDKSAIVDLDQTDITDSFPLFANATGYECILNPGDAIFIPSLWFHNTKALQFSIGVNFFWKDTFLDEFYNKSDVYGNKDLIPASDAFSNIDKALKHLSKLPTKYRKFYIHLIIDKLNKQLEK